MGESLSSSSTNRERAEWARGALERMLQTALMRGFYGSVELKVEVKDGTIMEVVERPERRLK